MTDEKNEKIPSMIVPMNKRVTVRIERPVEKTAGGILIPEVAQDKEAPTRGTIMAVSLDCRDDIKQLIKPGMQIIFSKYAGVDVFPKKSDGTDEEIRYQILKEEDILAVLINKELLPLYVYDERFDNKKEDLSDGEREIK